MKQSNNPFKMIGPYLGAIFVAPLIFLISEIISRMNPYDTYLAAITSKIFSAEFLFNYIHLIVGLPLIIILSPALVLILYAIGFIAGWGITYLIRKYKR